MKEKIFIIEGREWYVSIDEYGHREISMQIFGDDDCDAVQKKLADPNCTFSNTSSIGLVSNALAEARAEAYAISSNKSPDAPENQKATRMLTFIDRFDAQFISEPLKALSCLVNQRCADPEKQLKALSDLLDLYIDSLSHTNKQPDHYIKDLNLSSEKKAFIKEDIQSLTDSLLKNAKQFKKKLKKSATFEDVDYILSAQNRGNESSLNDTDAAVSLGDFLTEQSRLMCDTAVEATKTLDERYLFNVINVNPISTAFESAGSKLRVKNALYGREHIDTHSIQTDTRIKKSGPGRLSLEPYLPNGVDGTTADLDKIVCLVSETPLSQRVLSQPAKGEIPYLRGVPRAGKFAFLYLAPLLDAALFIPRVLLNPVLMGVRFVIPQRYTAQFDAITQSTFSLPAKRLWHEQYKRLDENGLPEENEHQALLDDHTNTKMTSLFAIFFKWYSPQSMSERLISDKPTDLFAGMNEKMAADPNNTIFNQFSEFSTRASARSAVFFRTFRDIRKPEDVYAERERAYDTLKPVMAWLIQKAQDEQSGKSHDEMTYYPGPAHLRENQIDSPTRVFSDVMYILNEQVINHLTDTMPGPATFMFMMSLASFGSNFVPVGGIAGLQGLTYALNKLPILVGKEFMGYSGSMATSHGLFANVMEFKLANLAVMSALGAMNKHNTFLEALADDPEKVIAGFSIYVGMGMAIGYIPLIPTFGASLNIYRALANTFIDESKMAQGGLMPLTTPEYGFLSYKLIKIVEDLTKEGKSSFSPTEFEKFAHAFIDAKVLDMGDAELRDAEINKILKHFNVTDEATGLLIKKHVNETFTQKDKIKERVNVEKEKALNEIAQIKTVLDNAPQHKTPKTPYEKLSKAIQMLGDTDAPLTFSPAQRDDAILFYNHLNQLFDDYNASIKDKPGCIYIPKEDYLLAFRNKFCPTGRHLGAGLIRQLSVYPGYPFRWLAREVQLQLYKDSPFVVDTIHARREEDIVLWREWGAMASQSTYAAFHLLNKAIKFCVWTPLALYNTTMAAFNGTESSVALEKAGRWVDEHVRLDEVSLPQSNLKGRTSRASHTASDYNNVREASQVLRGRLELNEKLRTQSSGMVISALSSSSHKSTVENIAPSVSTQKNCALTKAKFCSAEIPEEPKINDTSGPQRSA